ncbi:hypothetical protein AB205_0156910, partial [Aquarana catesbeiana]
TILVIFAAPPGRRGRIPSVEEPCAWGLLGHGFRLFSQNLPSSDPLLTKQLCPRN